MIADKQSIVEVKGEVVSGTLYNLRGVFYVGDPEEFDPHTFSMSMKTLPPYLFVSERRDDETETVKIKMGTKRVLDITVEKGGIYMICYEKDNMLFEHPNGYGMYRLIPAEDKNGNKVFDFYALMKKMGYRCRTAKKHYLRYDSWKRSIREMRAIASDLGVFYRESYWLDCWSYECTLKLARGTLMFAGDYSISVIGFKDMSHKLYYSREAEEAVKLLLKKPYSVEDDEIPNFIEKYGTEEDVYLVSFRLYDWDFTRKLAEEK